MAQQLTKGMYGEQYSFSNKNLFGLRCGSIRYGDTKIIHNGGWYNKYGEKLGWGDLSAEDFERIARELESNELFVVLGEEDSHWNFIVRSRIVGMGSEAPGLDYVAEHAQYVVTKGQTYHVSRFQNPTSWPGFKILKPSEVKTLMIASINS